MTFKVGAPVVQVQPVALEGEVVERNFSESADQMQYHVRNKDGSVDRWFLESEITAVTV